MNTATLTPLDQPARGTARLSAAGVLTVGVYADGEPARWQLNTARRARHALIIGATGAGISCLLRSVLDGAHAAGASTQLVDLSGGWLADSPHPSVVSVGEARTVLAMTAGLARARLAARDVEHPLLVLAVDGLHHLAADPACAQQLAALMNDAAQARIAVLAAGYDASVQACAGEPVRTLLAQHTLVLLRTNRPGAPLLGDAPAIPRSFAGDTSTAGVGYLPRQRPGVPFRAWLP